MGRVQDRAGQGRVMDGAEALGLSGDVWEIWDGLYT